MPKKPAAPPKLTPELPPAPPPDDAPTNPGVEADREVLREDDETEIIHRDDLKR